MVGMGGREPRALNLGPAGSGRPTAAEAQQRWPRFNADADIHGTRCHKPGTRCVFVPVKVTRADSNQSLVHAIYTALSSPSGGYRPARESMLHSAIARSALRPSTLHVKSGILRHSKV